MQRSERLRIWLDMTYRSVPSLVTAVGGDFKDSTVRQWLKGASEPGAASLAALYESGLSVHWYLSGEGSMFSETPRGSDFGRRAGQSADAIEIAAAGMPDTAEMKAEINRAVENVLRRYS